MQLLPRFEQLAGPQRGYKCPEDTRLLLTSVYGFYYEVTYCKQTKELLWSQNLPSENLRKAATEESLRSDPSVNEEILDFFFNTLFEDLKKAIARWRNPTLIPVPTATAESMTPNLLPTLHTIRLTPVVLSNVMDPLTDDTNWPRVPTGPLCLNLQLLWVGNNAVWEDIEKGIVFKQYFTANGYNSELGFYRRLGGLSWIPTMLGTVSTSGRWGIFTSFAGRQVYDDGEEAVPTIKGWVTVLHSLGIHNHDIAPRNVLKGSNGLLTLVDFDRAVESAQCDLSECPDLEFHNYYYD
ncbi:hypothetical protein BJ165DRAFT_124221 [Panaeolus papilionaceus]|nr:hypothetical protein BJ165DRAFT_124221 [Panaeolus papilionaceus]